MKQSDALDILKTGANVFLTGEPGSGKTYTVNAYVSYLRHRGIEPAITASTGVAATHLGGLTIHSWSGIGIKDTLSKSDLSTILEKSYLTKRIKASRVLVIDEVSMLSPQTLNLVDTVCRAVKKNAMPFGGLQTIFVGDFFQLPPIFKQDSITFSQARLFSESVGTFAYESAAWTGAEPVICYLSEQHRQDDKDYLSILSAIRRNEFTDDHLVFLKERKVSALHPPDRIPTLFAHNMDVDRVNKQMLAKLPGERHGFVMKEEGKTVIVETLKRGCLSPQELHLKVDATVMFTKNSPKDGFVNGTLGVVEGFMKENGRPIIKTRSGQRIIVEPMSWMVEENGKMLGRLTQFPLRLAWAITVHKSQGMSMDAAVMDLSSVFEYGQGYVALSRVRRLSGLFLLGWNEQAFQVHPEILMQDRWFRSMAEEANTQYGGFSLEDLRERHEKFLLACDGTIQAEPQSKKQKSKKIDTKSETLALWNQGKNLVEIAQTRELKESTIFSHIEQLVQEKKILKKDLSRIASADLHVALPTIHQAFDALGTDSLSAVFEYLYGKYRYDELRIARLLLE